MAPQSRKAIWMVGSGGPITDSLIHRVTKCSGFLDACVRFSFPVLPFSKTLCVGMLYCITTCSSLRRDVLLHKYDPHRYIYDGVCCRYQYDTLSATETSTQLAQNGGYG